MFVLKLFKNKFVLGAVLVVVAFLVSSTEPSQKAFNKSYDEVPGRPPELPRVVPADFPIYPRVKVWRMSAKTPTDFAVGFGSHDGEKKVYDYLLEKAKKMGWEIREQKRTAFRAVKGKTTVTISVRQNPGEETGILEQIKLEQKQSE